ncbi:hypothetical protein K503DRAFT_777228 [Rhizopogon vinicolor AM-OR11-026]|uniref:Uncharacterized protein n=1 Tax=Rhizopogon vinicolor AM-OR11-026 TaxID=1314800 RepID=A0A1B7MGY1_9AGAM|nr:hypothetical protein K503DRAFT_777228 [Rhizopogon vinicolor AM-OR11-026]
MSTISTVSESYETGQTGSSLHRDNSPRATTSEKQMYRDSKKFERSQGQRGERLNRDFQRMDPCQCAPVVWGSTSYG